MKTFEKLNKNEMKMIVGGMRKDAIYDGGGDGGTCGGTCLKEGTTCKVPTACTQCACVDSSGYDRGKCS